ncbi:asaB hydroxylase/desaturase family protein [Abortiporus biennis]
MATATTLQPRDVPTTLHYFAPIGEESPYQWIHDPPAGIPATNVGAEPYPATIHDARGHESELTLDTTGFQFVKSESTEKDFTDEERIKNVYYKEVEELLKKETGAKRVLIFDHTIRLNNPAIVVDDSEKGRRTSVLRVHIDQTYEASVARVHRHLGDEADRLLKGRVRIINVWRPIGHPVAHEPLAVSDWRTLDTEHDLVPVRFLYNDPRPNAGIYAVKYNPNHKWYYLSNQTPDEVTLIKCYDSEVDRARLTPHTAFLDETSPKEAPHRDSIEIRALVFDSE